MTTCEICGTEFDELGVQIVLPGLAKSFDRIDCAARARALAGPPAHNVRPAPAVFVDVAPRGRPRLYGLPGLPAGFAATLAGGRARLALGGASLAVALLVATTVHLSSRIGGGSDLLARGSLLQSPPRFAGDFLFRGLAPANTNPAAVVAPAPQQLAPAPQQAEGFYLAANRTPNEAEARATSLAASEAQPRAQKRRAATRTRSSSRTTLARAGGNVSTRPGWGWGDKNHAHGGPTRSSASGKAGKAQGRRHK
jgi:hypothetical protein